MRSRATSTRTLGSFIAPLFAAAFLAAPLLSCASKPGDAPLDAGPPTPLGAGSRVRDVSDPSLPTHPKSSANVDVTGVTVVTIDTFDETNNGKSRGTVFVQDVGSVAPYSGISLYSPTYVPPDLRLAPGDVLDLNGTYQENTSIGTAVFPAGQVLPQIAKPVATFRFEYKTPTPAVIDVTDLDDYAKGRKWMNMLVTVKNVTLTGSLVNSGGRVNATLTPAMVSTLSNELYPLAAGTFPKGTHFASITGVVTWFFSFHIAPRSAADLVQ